MDKIRRIGAGIIIGLALCFLGACGGKDSKSAQGEVSEETSGKSLESGHASGEKKMGKGTGDLAGTTESELAAEENNEGIQHIEVGVVTYSHSSWDQATDIDPSIYLEMSMAYPVMQEETAKQYPKLASAFEQLSEQKQKSFNNDKDDLKSLIQAMAEDDSHVAGVSSKESGYVMRADTSVVSYCFPYESYMGGAHGDQGFLGINLDPQTGEILKLSDVVTDLDRFSEAVDQNLQASPYADKIYGYIDGIPEAIKEYLTSDDVEFLVGNEGITVIFNLYVLGPYAMGYQLVNVYYEEIPEIFNEQYINHATDYFIPYVDEVPLEIDANHDGFREALQIDDVYMEDNDGYSWTDYQVSYGENSLLIEDYAFSRSAYLCYTDGKYFLYLLQQTEGDYETLAIIDLQTMERTERGIRSDELLFSYEGVIEYENKVEDDYFITTAYPLIDPNSFLMAKRTYLLGTYTRYLECEMGEDGFPISNEKRCTVNSDYAMKTKKDLTVWMVDENGKKLEQTTIPENTYIYVAFTDAETYVDVRIVDEKYLEQYGLDDYVIYYIENKKINDNAGNLYRIEIEEDEYEHYIEGFPENEVMEGVLYAG